MGTNVDALVYGLKRFPALRRMTITPAAHGWIFAPLYETPMIRALAPAKGLQLPDSTQLANNAGWRDAAGGLCLGEF